MSQKTAIAEIRSINPEEGLAVIELYGETAKDRELVVGDKLYTHPSASVPDPDLQIIQERDYWEEKATELAEDVGKYLGIEVGEHSSANCPVQNAIDAVYNATPQPADNRIKCSERLPTAKDAGEFGVVSLGTGTGGHLCRLMQWDLRTGFTLTGCPPVSSAQTRPLTWSRSNE